VDPIAPHSVLFLFQATVHRGCQVGNVFANAIRCDLIYEIDLEMRLDVSIEC
jgi:hypothetical protein